MKQHLITTVLYGGMISGLICGTYFDISELLNLSLWFAWASIFLATLVLFVPSEKVYGAQRKTSLIYIRIMPFILLSCLVATGYFITASFWAIVWGCGISKRMVWESEKAEARAGKGEI